MSIVPDRPRLHARLAAALLLLLVIAAGCNTMPDKRTLQYLNTDGFGNRYTGNAEEENWVAIGDSISLTDEQNPDELNGTFSIDIDGTALFPVIGAVPIAGLTRSEIEALLMEKYSPYYDLLDIKVRIVTRGKKFFVFGEVANVGERDFPGDLTIFEAVMAAGPNKDSANLGRVRLIRADPKDPFIQTINLGDIIDKGDSTFNVHVQERDIIYVPPTMLAELGYFIDTLLFPFKLVLSGLSSAIFTYDQLRYGSVYRGGSGIF
ncbi:MAG: polysaccharide biosynthesis/export family protein [Planctomycetes bacterium]|nr:polysaccharide biosynthesis/export family protein [Planctomycetota bacterium]